ncbi:MAG TPA: hypothetical protein VK540_06435 [Polyangiaceae bacterium]|nr:hypothetical protein [Polyangiaceae bacterium]
MNQDRKVSVLRSLLERVQKRAAAPRVATAPEPVSDGSAASGSGAAAGAATPLVPAPPVAISAAPVQPPHAVAERSSRETAIPSGDAIADRGQASSAEAEADEGPPSAPRLREAAEDEDVVTEAPEREERERYDEEPPIKTPPPESGRQDVTPGPAIMVSEPDEDISITVTMEESELPPPVSPPAADVASMSAIGRLDMPDVSGPQPRLALVSEPEIELHGMTPLSAVAEPMTPAKPPPPPEASARSTASTPLRPQDVGLAVPVPSVPSAAPSGTRPVLPGPPPAAPFARMAPSVPDTKPSVSHAASSEPAAAAPVRLMAQPQADPSGRPMPPVEVWASTFAPAALHGQVASFVGQNAKFEPKTFGELVQASIALGEDKS